MPIVLTHEKLADLAVMLHVGPSPLTGDVHCTAIPQAAVRLGEVGAVIR
jgi:hypothetical protein